METPVNRTYQDVQPKSLFTGISKQDKTIKGLKDLVEKRLDALERAFDELNRELEKLCDTLEDMKLPPYDDEGG